MKLTERQMRMLHAEVFHLDGWCNPSSFRDANELVAHGLLSSFESGSDEQQYTAINYTITEAGRVALADQKQGGERS